MIISFPSPVEYYEWCEKFCSLLPTKSPQPHHLNAPYTPQQVSKVIPIDKLVFYLLPIFSLVSIIISWYNNKIISHEYWK
jgi:hypothetical protein